MLGTTCTAERDCPPHLTRATTLTNSIIMPYIVSKTKLMDVYCDVLIGIGEETRFTRLSATLRERVMQCVNSHIEAFVSCTKDVYEHNAFVQESQKFCKEQL